MIIIFCSIFICDSSTIEERARVCSKRVVRRACGPSRIAITVAKHNSLTRSFYLLKFKKVGVTRASSGILDSSHSVPLAVMVPVVVVLLLMCRLLTLGLLKLRERFLLLCLFSWCGCWLLLSLRLLWCLLLFGLRWLWLLFLDLLVLFLWLGFGLRLFGWL